MKRLAFLTICILLFATPALALYNIHLKNGSVIRGVASYTETDGQIMFHYAGGVVSIPAEVVEKIEEAREGGRVIVPGEAEQPPEAAPLPAPLAPEPPPMEPPPKTGHLKQRIAEIDKRLGEIAKEEKEYSDAVKEYDRVRLRIEVLFQQGIAEARKQGGDPAKWFEFLPPQERKWAQLNTLKKNKFDKDLKVMEQKLAPLLAEKKTLLEEKQDLQEEISRLEKPF